MGISLYHILVLINSKTAIFNFFLKYRWTNHNSKCNFHRIILERKEMGREDLDWIYLFRTGTSGKFL
jgi:hypothetical protein